MTYDNKAYEKHSLFQVLNTEVFRGQIHDWKFIYYYNYNLINFESKYCTDSVFIRFLAPRIVLYTLPQKTKRSNKPSKMTIFADFGVFFAVR